MQQFTYDTMTNDRITAANMGLAIAGGLCVIERLCFLFTFVLADSLVLRNACHRQAPKRCASSDTVLVIVKQINFPFSPLNYNGY